MICSFDVFDTCLIRACVFPHNVFDLLAYRVLGQEVSESERMDFANIRIQAELRAREELQREVTLENIYERCDFKGLTDLSCMEIAEMEKEVEWGQAVSVKSILELVNKLRKESNIIYISDMYLPQDFILSLLQEHGFWQKGDKLYVSSASGKTKRKGDLYDLVAQENEGKFKQWQHYGDNKHSDYHVPRRKGIQAHWVKHEFSKYEKCISKQAFFPAFFVQQHLAGISKAVRLTLNKGVRGDFAADLIAPLYVSFVYDILEDAQSNHINKLFFLARDGYILFLIANQLKPLFPGIAIEYIYVSRSALYFPGLKSLTKDGVLDLLKPFKSRKLYEVFNNRINIDISKYTDVNYFFNSEEEGEGYIKMLLENCELWNELKTIYEEQRALVEQYFIQTGLASTVSCNAIVDLRGTRGCHASINELLADNGFRTVRGYYLEVTNNRKSISQAGMYKAWWYGERYSNNECLFYISSLSNILEQYFSITDQERTIGYTLNTLSNYIDPVFETDVNRIDRKEIICVHEQTVLLYAHYFILNRLYLYNRENKYIVTEVIANFSVFPSYKYLRAFEGIQVCDSKADAHLLLKRLSITAVISFFYRALIRHHRENSKGMRYLSVNKFSFIYTMPFLSRLFIQCYLIFKNHKFIASR